MKAKRQEWNEKNDDVSEAYQNLKNALYDASIFADRYERALNGAKATTPEANRNLARRAGWAGLAANVISSLYARIQ